MKREFTTYEVGKQFPGPVPGIEGCVMELWEDGFLNVLVQMPALKREERRAFKKGFKRYSYLESDTPVPIAFWVFDFSAPHGPVECNFNARIVDPDYIKNWLDTSEGLKNAVNFYLLDGKILQGMRLVGLEPEAVELFHATIRKQLATEYSEQDYGRYLAGLCEFSVNELFSMGKRFSLKK